MNVSIVCVLVCCLAVLAVSAEEKAKSPLDFTLKANDGTDCALSQYKGKVILLVNVASKCGNTPQYKQLEELYEKYKDQGLVVIGVPCNDFGGQEPGSDLDVKKFCTDNYKVTFLLLSKVKVQGAEAAPLYKYLTESSPKPGKITWNFEKFLIGRNGQVANRFTPKTKPDDATVVKDIEAELKAK
ncbi:MAG: glutathione peroxidase [Planctomycetes bacterium]|nr:glutathione peroxidase [Planctomycetota bacterium]